MGFFDRKKFTVFISIISLGLIALGVYVYLKQQSISKVTLPKSLLENDFFYRDGEKWTKVDPKDFSSSSVVAVNIPEESNGKNDLMLKKLVKGYFVKYEENSKTLTMRTVILGSNFFRDILLLIPEGQIVYCWPEKIGDSLVKDIMFNLQTPPIISLPNENKLIFKGLANKLSNQSFLFAQLAKDIQTKTPNEIVKLAVICQ